MPGALGDSPAIVATHVLQCPRDALGQRGRVIRAHQLALPDAQDALGAARLGGHRGQAGRERFDQGHAKPLSAGREHEQVSIPELVQQSAFVRLARESDSVAEAASGYQALEYGTLRAVPHYPQRDVLAAGDQRGDRLHQEVVPLDVHQAAH